MALFPLTCYPVGVYRCALLMIEIETNFAWYGSCIWQILMNLLQIYASFPSGFSCMDHDILGEVAAVLPFNLDAFIFHQLPWLELPDTVQQSEYPLSCSSS